MFILGEQLDSDCVQAFASYMAYLQSNRERFPPSAYALATSDWYFGNSSHQAPHDAWLESIVICEPSAGSRNEQRACSISIKLFGAYHDGYIEFTYPTVFEYQLTANTLGRGHGDWRYDEFRINEKNQLIHEIEWVQFGGENTWIIVASDIQHKWVPLT